MHNAHIHTPKNCDLCDSSMYSVVLLRSDQYHEQCERLNAYIGTEGSVCKQEYRIIWQRAPENVVHAHKLPLTIKTTVVRKSTAIHCRAIQMKMSLSSLISRSSFEKHKMYWYCCELAEDVCRRSRPRAHKFS